jgi:hypothetical protein
MQLEGEVVVEGVTRRGEQPRIVTRLMQAEGQGTGRKHRMKLEESR